MWELIAQNTIFHGNSQGFAEFVSGPTFLPYWDKYDRECHRKCAETNTPRGVLHMNAVSGLSRRIIDPEGNLPSDIGVPNPTEAMRLTRLLNRVVDANHSDGSLFPESLNHGQHRGPAHYPQGCE